jgi:pSer/pThr/pTyr-binding forkhead associated (FHA) protein
MSGAGRPPATPRAATAAELKAHMDAERAGLPFLVFRDGEAQQRIFVLADRGDQIAVGRDESLDVALSWDEEVSRVHAELRQIGGEWILVDDGLSMNGSFVNGTIVHGRRRLHDGDTLRIGNTMLLFRDPSEADTRTTARTGEPELTVSLSDAQKRVLVALCRPFKMSTAFVTPATNEQIAGELFLSVDAVKKHMRALFEKFGVEELPQGEKRTRVVERAFAAGLVSEHDL